MVCSAGRRGNWRNEDVNVIICALEKERSTFRSVVDAHREKSTAEGDPEGVDKMTKGDSISKQV